MKINNTFYFFNRLNFLLIYDRIFKKAYSYFLLFEDFNI